MPVSQSDMELNTAYNDAERGVSEDVYTVSLPPSSVTDSPKQDPQGPPSNEKLDIQCATPPSQDEKKAVAPPAIPAPKREGKPAPAKPKWKRASRWVRFKLWYNTYR